MDTVVASLLSGGIIASIIVAVKELIMWKLNRKAKIEDDNSERVEVDKKLQEQLDEHTESISQIIGLLNELNDKLDCTMKSSRVTLKDRIKCLGMSYIKKGSVTYEDRSTLHDMWHIYHFDLNGNGDLDSVMKLVDELPLEVG